MTRKNKKQKRSDNDSPLRIGPLVMRLGTERDPRLRELTDKEAIEDALDLMAFSLNLLWESVGRELKTKNEKRIDLEVRKLLAKFDQQDTRWQEMKNRDHAKSSSRGNH